MLVLYKDHTIKKKEDDYLSEKDFKNTQYLMIDTSTYPSETTRNFFVVDPSVVPYFTKAKIKYQLISIHVEEDEDISDFPLDPVYLETDKISDVFNLLNCIDRLNITNEYIRNDQYTFSVMFIFIGYFEVALYNENKKIYHKSYTLPVNDYKNEEYEFNTKKILKVFRDIYNTDFVYKLYKKNEYLFIYDDLRWAIRNYDVQYDLIGVPLTGSKTITFCKDTEYLNIIDCRYFDYTFSIHEDEISQREFINKALKNKKYENVETLNLDFYMVSSDRYELVYMYKFFMLDMISHIWFSMSLIYLFFLAMYTPPVGMYSYKEDEENEDILDIILSIGTSHKSNQFTCDLLMNLDVFIPLDELLKLI